MGLGLSSPSEGGAALLGIGEALTVEDLKFSILFDDSEDDGDIIGEPIHSGGVEYECALRRGHTL